MVGRTCLYVMLTALVAFPSIAGAQDLKIKANSTVVPLSGGATYAGQKFTVKSIVWNDATTGFSQNFYLYYFYCPANNSALSACTYLSYSHISTNFVGDQELSVTSPTMYVPTAAVYGTGYIRFYVDYTAPNPTIKGYVSESNENNNSADHKITVTTRPDLYVYYAQFPYTGSIVTVGATFTGRIRIRNNTSTSKTTSGFNLRYSYCPGKSSTGCIQLGTQSYTSTLNAATVTGYFNTPLLTMPQGAQNGTRYIQTYVDFDGKVTESVETNNIYYTGINVTSVPSDLKVSYISAPYTGNTNQAGAKFTVYTTLHNDSKHGFTTDFQVGYYYCPTKSTTGCTYLSYINVSQDFAPGQKRNYISSQLTLPNTALYGAGYIMAFVDYGKKIPESNETNNYTYQAVTVTKKPDLLLYTSQFPYTGSISTVGASFNGRVRIRNNTYTSMVTTNYKLTYYYCPTVNVTTGCIKLGDQNVTTDLQAGQVSGYITTPTMTMPAGTQNGTRYIRTHVDSGYAVSESNEANNNYYQGITVNMVPSDLKVIALTAPYTGTTSQAGATFTAFYTIHNDSLNGFTTNFYVYYYYCPTTTTKTSSCTYITNTSISHDFPAGQKRSYISGVLTLPTSAVYGTGYLRVLADATGKIPELNNDNNHRDDAISVIKRPDLYTSYAQFPSTGGTSTVGSLFTGRMRVTNANYTSKVTTNFELTYYFCPSNTTAGCIQLGKQTVTTDLVAGGSTGYFYTPTYKIPAGAQNGTRYIRTFVDSGNAVSESKETNNNYYTAITVSQVTSDLQVTKTSAPASGTTKSAGSQFSVQCDVQNNSKNGFTKDFRIYYYYCQNANTTNCTYLNYTNVTDNFAAGQTRSYSSPTLYVPVQAVYGSGYIRFFADATSKIVESNENNNNAYDAITVGAKPDLYVGTTSVPYSGTTAGPGSTFTGRYRIYNKASTSKVVADFNVDFYYCPSNSTTGCIKLGTQKISTDINTGTYTGYLYTPKLTLPAAVKTGSRYLRFVVDSGGVVTESDETNNNYYDAITVSSQQPDLTIISATAPASGTLVGAGSKFTVKSTVNCSGSKVSTNFDMHYYYCTSNAATSCTQLGTQSITYDFKANESKEFVSSSLTLPSTAVYGKGYIRFYADANNAVTESSESNNEVYKQITLNGKPDIKVAASTVPYTGSTTKPSSVFTAQYTVANASNTNAFATDFTVSFYFCTAKSAGSCTQLSTQSVTQDFKSGSQYTFTSPSLTVPASAKPGSYFLRIWLDSANTVAEFDENNNDKYDPISVIGDPDFVVSTFTAKTSSTTVDYSIMVCNMGDTTTKSFDVELYFNQASTPDCNSPSDHQWAISGLGKAACVTKTFTRLNVAIGIYLGWARVDADCKVKESDENNNNKSMAYTVSLPPDLGPDLGPDMGPDLGPDMGPDIGPDMGPDVGPEAGTNEAGTNEAGTNEAGTNEAGTNEAGTNEAGATEGGVENEGGVPTEAGTNEAGADEAGTPKEGGAGDGADDGAKPDQEAKKDVSVNFEGGAGDGPSTADGGGGDDKEEGCNCAVGGHSSSTGLGLLLLMGLLVLFRRRRS